MTATKKKSKINDKVVMELYHGMLKPRLIEEKMLSLLRQGRISKWFSGIGQEAIAVGATEALKDDEWIFPMHRNLGVFTSRNIPLANLFAQWQGKAEGFTRGRDRSFHFGSQEHHIWGMISHLGPQLSLAAGVALGYKLRKEPKISLAFTGEGGTSEGEFHEALNVAAVWDLPVIFLVENNGYGLSTPSSEQFKARHIADKGIGYGMEAVTIDGNDVETVYSTIDKYAKKMRKKPFPVLIECETFRMRGHEEASGVKYVPKELMDEWAKKDPIERLEKKLIKSGLMTQKKIDETKQNLKKNINEELKSAYDASEVEVDSETELSDVFRRFDFQEKSPQGQSSDMRFIDAISNGLEEAMRHHEQLILMGQDIAEYGGVFKITEGFLNKYGKERVRNTPLCESAIVGIALGLSAEGFKSMVEMQFADFVTCGFNQIVNNLAKIHYRWGINADVVVRMPCGAGVGAGPFHSQTNEAWFAHTPGLKIVYPATPEDAKGLLISAFEDPNPVMYFEHKAMYRTQTGQVPKGYYNIPIGKARLAREGSACSIITYGMGVHWATELCEMNNFDAEVIDLRSLVPLDYDMIRKTVQKTNKVLILQEDCSFGSIGGEISAFISEHLFEYLDAPVIRVGSLDTPIPFTPALEDNYLAKARLEESIQKLLTY